MELRQLIATVAIVIALYTSSCNGFLNGGSVVVGVSGYTSNGATTHHHHECYRAGGRGRNNNSKHNNNVIVNLYCQQQSLSKHCCSSLVNGNSSKRNSGRRTSQAAAAVKMVLQLSTNRKQGGELVTSLATSTSTALAASPLPEVPTSPPKAADSKKIKFGESTSRSLVKALCWRLTAAVITLISGLVFAKDIRVAATIVGSDFLTKSGFMFVGERLWSKVKWGQGGKGDSNQRSLAKALIWRLFAASNTLICSIFLAKDLGIASKIAGTDTIFKTTLFYFFERIWNNVEWGKEYEVEYTI